MEEVSKATFKVGIKFVVDNGKFFIQIGDALLEFARLPPALQKTIEDTVFSSIVTSAKMFPYLSFLATLFMAYRLREAENSAERSATQAAEAQAQAAEAVRKAQEQINRSASYSFPMPEQSLIPTQWQRVYCTLSSGQFSVNPTTDWS